LHDHLGIYFYAMHPFRAYILPVLATVWLAACGSKETVVLESGPITLTAAGPLFEGSNTAQGEWKPDLEGFLKSHGARLDQLSSARVTAAALSSSTVGPMTGIRSVTMMLASDTLDMIQIAVLNPLPADTASTALTTATEQAGLEKHLKQAVVTVVADLDLDADSEQDRQLIGTLTIELQLDR